VYFQLLTRPAPEPGELCCGSVPSVNPPVKPPANDAEGVLSADDCRASQGKAKQQALRKRVKFHRCLQVG